MNIMVIDDSFTVRKILWTCLTRAGYTVAMFSDGVEAMRELSNERTPLPSLVIVDLALPKMDGYEVIMRLKRLQGMQQAVFLILSRRDGIIDRMKGHLAGASAHLAKPFKTLELVEMVQNLLKEHGYTDLPVPRNDYIGHCSGGL